MVAVDERYEAARKERELFWQGVYKLQEELKTRKTARNCEDELVFNNPRRTDHNRQDSFQYFFGDIETVLDHAAWIFQHDSCTPMYEHMLYKIDNYRKSNDGNHMYMMMSKSSYAGD